MVVGGMTASTVSISRSTEVAMTSKPQAFRQVEASESIQVGPDLVPMGALGVAFAEVNDEVEVDFYSPKHVVVYASASQLQQA